MHAAATCLVNEASVAWEVHEATPRYDAQLAVQIVEARARLVAHNKVNAAVDQVLAAPPAGCHTAGVGMMLKDVALVTVHLGVAASRQAGQSGADDDQ